MHQFKNSSWIIDKLWQRYGFLAQMDKLYMYWENVVGKKLASKISIVGMKKGTLFVRVSSPAYHHQLKLSCTEWLKKLNSYFNEELIKQIKVVNIDNI